MEIHIGHLYEGNKPILSNVQVSLYSPGKKRLSQESWVGVFRFPSGIKAPKINDRYRLVLTDKRSGFILIGDITGTLDQRARRVYFRGTGSLE